jgi:ribosomal protein S18 acetylase RimI-like enzyme
METPAMTVRAATAADAGAIARVQGDAWRRAFRGLVPLDVIPSVGLARRGPGKVEVVEDESGIIAFCAYGPTRDDDVSAEIYAIYVHPDSWRRGAGRLLCERAVAAAAQRDHREITLWVLKGNDPARRFYEQMGFAPDGASRCNTTFLTAPFDEVRYRKTIG